MDTAFKGAAFSGFTTAELRAFAGRAELEAAATTIPEEIISAQARLSAYTAELERREKRDAGDVSVMTSGERLAFMRKSSLSY